MFVGNLAAAPAAADVDDKAVVVIIVSTADSIASVHEALESEQGCLCVMIIFHIWGQVLCKACKDLLQLELREMGHCNKNKSNQPF